MRNVSSAFKEALKNDQREYIEYADFVLEDGTTLNLTNSDFWQNGFSYEDSVSPNNKFQVGSAVINKVNLVINNIYGDFDSYDFFGAVAIIGVGLEINGVVERINFGEFTVVDQPDYNGSLISIELYDNMFKFDKPYSESNLGYPATLEAIILDACTCCGVLLGTTNFPNKNFEVQECPDDENLTFREVIAYVSQIAGCYARIEYSVEGHDGRLALRWFDNFTPSIPEELFNTKDGMTAAYENAWKDTATETLSGVDWFEFDGKTANNIYVNSNSWIVIGGTQPSSASSNVTGDLNIFKRDGQSNSLYYQNVSSGQLKYVKVRFEGYTRYQQSYQTDAYKLVYELFFIPNGDIILNVINKPTSTSYLGTSSIVAGGVTKTLNLDVGIYRLYLDGTGWEQEIYDSSGTHGHIAIDSIYNHRVSTDDVVITGIKVSMDVEHEHTITESGSTHTETVYEKAEYLEGTDGYVLAIENNPLIAETQIQGVAEYLGGRIIGFAFRTASAMHGSDPSIEAGDIAYLINGKGQTYPIVVSKTKFAVGSAQSTESVAEEPIRNSAARFSVEAQNYVKARKRIAEEKTQRQLIEDEINARIDNAGGLYETEVQQQGGGVITYLHNLPVLAESDIQIMVSSVGVMVTANGTAQQPTWYGLTVDGTLLANILSATGINADWINTGTLHVGGSSNTRGVIEVFNASGTRVIRIDNTGQYIGNIASSLTNPNTKIDTAGAITTKSLTANDYIYVDGNNQTFFSIPFTVVHNTGNATGKLTLSRTGGFVANIGTGQSENSIDFSYKSQLDSKYYYGFRLKQVYTNMYSDLSGGAITLFDGASNVSIFEAYKGRFYVNAGNGTTFYSNSRYGEYTISALIVGGNFRVDGTKSRRVQTKDYGDRLLYSYETPSPMFGDVGEGTIGNDGKCYVQIDGVFAETVSLNQYQVFLQKYGEGDCWVSERHASFFVVEGTSDLAFGWELKAKQSDFDQYRLETDDLINTNIQNSIDYANELNQHIRDIQHEREVA